MKRNNFFSRFIVVTLTTALLLMSGSRAIPVSALAVGPLADPVYDTEIIAFKDYVEQNLSAPQLDIMFFLVGGLAVAQMGAQDAMLISPYPNEENVKEWIINCGIQLYNSVIGLVPEGDYYMGIPSIGTAGQKGVPRQVIKALVAQMMGDAVVAINYPNLDTFLEENPDKILLPFNADLQLGVNAVFGLNGNLTNWQNNVYEFTSDMTWNQGYLTAQGQADLLAYELSLPVKVRANETWAPESYRNMVTGNNTFFSDYRNFFINTSTNTFYLAKNDGTLYNLRYLNSQVMAFGNSSGNFATQTFNIDMPSNIVYSPATYPDVKDLIKAYLNHTFDNYYYGRVKVFFEDFIKHYYVGTSWNNKTEVFNSTDLNILDANNNYYNQVQTDYLFDLRGLMGDLVNYVYLNPIWDNLYDLLGVLVDPDLNMVSIDLTPITDLLAPPVPVNLNEIAELTDNTYLERVKEHARNAGDIFANYVAFWHNCDSDLVYTMFGAAILVLVGAFVGKWGHS